MTKAKELDEFIERKIGAKETMSTRDMDLDSDEEYFLFVNASIRMIDKDAYDCPFSMILIRASNEVTSGKYLVPNATIERKRIYMIHDDSDPRLIGNKNRLYDRATCRLLQAVQERV